MYYIIKETKTKHGDKWSVEGYELVNNKMFLCLDDAVRHLEQLAQYYEHRTDKFFVVNRSNVRRGFSACQINKEGTKIFGGVNVEIVKTAFRDEY